MTAERLMDAVGQIDDALVIDAIPRKKLHIPVLVKAAAAILLVFGIGFSVYWYQTRMATAATVTFDVNPSLEIRLNSRGEVIALEGVNGRGRDVAKSIALNGKSCADVSEKLAGYMLDEGFLNDDRNTVLVTAFDDTGRDSQIADSIRESHPQIAVISNHFIPDEKTRVLADKYHISLGKARLITLLSDRSDYCTVQALASSKYSITDLCLFAERSDITLDGFTLSGSPSDTGILSEDEAIRTAAAYGSLSEKQFKNVSVILSATGNGFVYIVKLSDGDSGYAYYIKADSGFVTKVVRAGKTQLDNIGKETDDRKDTRTPETQGYIPQVPTSGMIQPITAQDVTDTPVTAAQPTVAPKESTVAPTALPTAAPTESPTEGQDFTDNEVIICLTEEAGKANPHLTPDDFEGLGVLSVERISYDGQKWQMYYLTLDRHDQQNVLDVAAQLEKRAEIKWADPNYIYTASLD